LAGADRPFDDDVPEAFERRGEIGGGARYGGVRIGHRQQRVRVRNGTNPIRFAGTCSMYSKNATPQLTSAAIHHGRAARSSRWAYQAKVMKTFDSVSSRTVCSGIGRVLIGG